MRSPRSLPSSTSLRSRSLFLALLLSLSVILLLLVNSSLGAPLLPRISPKKPIAAPYTRCPADTPLRPHGAWKGMQAFRFRPKDRPDGGICVGCPEQTEWRRDMEMCVTYYPPCPTSHPLGRTEAVFHSEPVRSYIFDGTTVLCVGCFSGSGSDANGDSDGDMGFGGARFDEDRGMCLAQ